MILNEEESFVKEKKKKILCIVDKQDQSHRLSAVETNQLKDAIEQKIKSMGLHVEENPVSSEHEDAQIEGSLMEGEDVIYRGMRVWYLVPENGIQQETWRPGRLYVSNKRLFWWYDFEERIVFDLPVNKIISVGTEMRKTSGLDSKNEKVLAVAYTFDSAKKTASFAGGRHIDEWAEILNRIISGKPQQCLS